MKKYLFFSSLIIVGLLAFSGWLSAETTKVQSGKVETKVIEFSPTEASAVPSASKSSTLMAETIKKCGVNTFSVSNECGVGAFKNLYFQCYDGYEEKQGGESSCKSSEVWQKYAESACLNHCSAIEIQAATREAVSLPSAEAVEVVPSPEAIPVCYISDELMEEYNELILQFKKAESAGSEPETGEITEKIVALKQKIAENRDECLVSSVQPAGSTWSVTEEAPRPAAAVAVNRCQEVAQWEEKIAYYEKLKNLSDADLKKETGFSKEEIDKVLTELSAGLDKVKEQCSLQMGITAATPIMSTERMQITEQVKPVVVESGQEIDVYYKAEIEKITNLADIDEQIDKLKTLKDEIGQLIEKLIKSRKEIEAGEFGNLVTEIKLSQGEIKADEVVVKTTEKKVLLEVGEKPVSLEPTENEVIIKDSGLEVKAAEVFVRENTLRVGNSEVKIAASEVTKRLNLSPKSVELKEEKEKAVYEMKVDEPRKLFGFIPLTIQKTVIADAEAGNLLEEQLPWYAFFTTK